MRFNSAVFFAAVLSALTTAVVADSMIVIRGCPINPQLPCDYTQATFYTSFGGFAVDASGGCKSTPIPGMTEFCIDWPMKRGHFKFASQANKRCLLKREATEVSGCPSQKCWRSEWVESTCTW